MSDLRQALEKLADRMDEQCTSGSDLRELLAAHPVEPAEMSDAARAWADHEDPEGIECTTPARATEVDPERIRLARIAAGSWKPAAEVDPETRFARPLLDREAVYRVVALWMPYLVDRSVVTGATDAVMKLGRPMPTHLEVAERLHGEKHSEGCTFTNPGNCDRWHEALREAVGVLTLLNGTES